MSGSHPKDYEESDIYEVRQRELAEYRFLLFMGSVGSLIFGVVVKVIQPEIIEYISLRLIYLVLTREFPIACGGVKNL